LPTGVLALLSDNDFGDTSALLITLESDQKTYRELESYLDELENRLRRIKSVSKLRHYGLQKEQISIYIEKEKLTNYGINTATLAGNLFTQGFTTMSGTVDNDQFIAPIHISHRITANRILPSKLFIRSYRKHHPFKRRARIVREYPDADSYISNNGHKSLLISMEMQPGITLYNMAKKLMKYWNNFNLNYKVM